MGVVGAWVAVFLVLRCRPRDSWCKRLLADGTRLATGRFHRSRGAYLAVSSTPTFTGGAMSDAKVERQETRRIDSTVPDYGEPTGPVGVFRMRLRAFLENLKVEFFTMGVVIIYMLLIFADLMLADDPNVDSEAAGKPWTRPLPRARLHVGCRGSGQCERRPECSPHGSSLFAPGGRQAVDERLQVRGHGIPHGVHGGALRAALRLRVLLLLRTPQRRRRTGRPRLLRPAGAGGK